MCSSARLPGAVRDQRRATRDAMRDRGWQMSGAFRQWNGRHRRGNSAAERPSN